MSNSTICSSRRTMRLTWLIAPLLLIAVAVAGSFTVFMAHAAPAVLSPLSGHYKFQGVTTSGPKTGLAISGQVELLVSGTTVTGHMCGLQISDNHSHCTSIAGTTDGTNVAFTISSFVQFPSVHAVGKFVNNLVHKGASGFAGTYTIGTGANASSGTWTAINASVPSIAGSWNFYAIVQQGKDKGQQLHATITLIAGANDTYTGIYCVKAQSCVALHGEDNYSYVRLFVGVPITIVLRGTYTFAGEHIASGEFYTTDKSNDKGYWLIH